MTHVTVGFIMKMLESRPKGVRDSLFADWFKWQVEWEEDWEKGHNSDYLRNKNSWSCYITLEGVRYGMRYDRGNVFICNDPSISWLKGRSIIFNNITLSNHTPLINLSLLQTEIDELMAREIMED